MALVSDVIIISCTLIVALYCVLLSKRLRRLTRLDGEIGSVIEGLTVQIGTLTTSVNNANFASQQSVVKLQSETERAEAAARHLEILISSLHSLSTKTERSEKSSPFKARDFSRLEPTS